MSLKYEVTGQGPQRVIVIHNWMSTLRSYDAVRPYLDGNTFKYAFMDVRGYGVNKDVSGNFTAQEAARDAIEIADSLGWKDFHVVGHSMSGMIAQRVCVEARDRVKSLVAITPVTAAGMPLDDQSKQMFAAAATQDEPWLGIAKMLTSARLPESWYGEQLRHFRSNVKPEAALGYLEMFATTNFASEMSGLKMPALAILGRHDFAAFTDDAMRQTLGKWLPSLTVEVIESAGHHPMQETPPYFVQVLESFLGKHS